MPPLTALAPPPAKRSTMTTSAPASAASRAAQAPAAPNPTMTTSATSASMVATLELKHVLVYGDRKRLSTGYSLHGTRYRSGRKAARTQAGGDPLAGNRS